MVKWLKDPLVSFLIAGTAIFFITDWFGEEDIPYNIVVSEQDLERLGDQWRMQMRRAPTDPELTGLVEAFIKEEIYYRQAQRLGLDRNDTIVRRRMVQKLTFLTEDIATAAPLDEFELRAFYDAHLEQYRVPQRLSFRHKYFSSDRRDNAQADATAALQNDETTGDSFMLQREYAQRSEREIGDLFGPDFAEQLTSLEIDEAWQGPVRSAYGWHTVQLITKQPAAIEAFEIVRERVGTDLQQAARKDANEAYYLELRGKYDLHYPSQRK
jgi:hypothetical protein